MSRRIPDGSIILTTADCRVLYDVAQLGPLRTRFRLGDNRTYELLREITEAAFSAAPGNEPRQDAASEKTRNWWTTGQLGKATRRAARTIRHDIEIGILPAEKTRNGWLIEDQAAQIYIEARRNQ